MLPSTCIYMTACSETGTTPKQAVLKAGNKKYSEVAIPGALQTKTIALPQFHAPPCAAQHHAQPPNGNNALRHVQGHAGRTLAPLLTSTTHAAEKTTRADHAPPRPPFKDITCILSCSKNKSLRRGRVSATCHHTPSTIFQLQHGVVAIERRQQAINHRATPTTYKRRFSALMRETTARFSPA